MNKEPQPLDYADWASAESASARSWAWIFFAAGLYALACFPAVLLFEHLGWPETLLHLTAFLACVVCVVSALKYLLSTRHAGGRGTLMGVPTRTLAYVAMALAGGFLLFVVAIVLLLSFQPGDF